MQCSREESEDAHTGQHQSGDPLPPQEVLVKNCEGEGKAIESVGEKTKVSGHLPPPSADSTRSHITDNIQTDNNEKKINNAQNENLGQNNNSNSYEFAGNVCSSNEKVASITESSPVIPESHQSGQAARPEVAQNISSSSDQFINLNGRVQQQNIDPQYSSSSQQQFDHQQSYHKYRV